jgi:hypothetical protein
MREERTLKIDIEFACQLGIVFCAIIGILAGQITVVCHQEQATTLLHKVEYAGDLAFSVFLLPGWSGGNHQCIAPGQLFSHEVSAGRERNPMRRFEKIGEKHSQTEVVPKMVIRL